MTFGPCPEGDQCQVPHCDGTDFGHDLAVDFPEQTARVADAERQLLERIRIRKQPEPIEGRAICGETAASCRCVKDTGHVDAGDPNHGCNPADCTGEWTGTYDNALWNGGRAWAIVTLPAFPKDGDRL